MEDSSSAAISATTLIASSMKSDLNRNNKLWRIKV
jgi:hypothetical protein